MARHHLSAAAGLAAGAVLALLAGEANAQTVPFQYAVKFICGKSEGRVVAPGQYFTAINVHNPGETGIEFRKKFAIALPGEKPGRISKFFGAKLGPDEAFEIDCPDILRRLDATGFVKGFAVIQSREELDVVAVYTAAGSTGRIETMDVEHVKPRIGGGGTAEKPDLIPVPDASGSFCRIKDHTLIVTVKNLGPGAAGASTTTVTFAAGPASVPTPPLAAGATVDLQFPVPSNCFQPDCHFRIFVDSGLVVDETNETNNTASGTCIG